MIREQDSCAATFGGRVRSSRQRLRGSLGKRWTQGDLAAAIGVERNTVSRWENGGILPKDPAVLVTLARTLCVSADWLLDGFAPGVNAGDRDGGDIGSRGSPGGALNERPGTEMYFPPNATDLAALPAAAADQLRKYLARLRGAGCTVEQVRGAAAVMLSGASNTIARRALAERDNAEILADVDSAWDFVTQVLRREGIRP